MQIQNQSADLRSIVDRNTQKVVKSTSLWVLRRIPLNNRNVDTARNILVPGCHRLIEARPSSTCPRAIPEGNDRKAQKLIFEFFMTTEERDNFSMPFWCFSSKY